MKTLFKLLVFCILFLLAAVWVRAQKLTDAHELYDMYEFEEAAIIYKRIIDKNQPGAEIAMERLADCYRFLNNNEEAEEWYAKAMANNPDISDRAYFNYGLVLRNNGKYAGAKEQFEKYATFVPSDMRGTTYAAYMDEILSWKKVKVAKRGESMEVRNLAQLNSEFADESPVYYPEKGYVFTSERASDTKKRKRPEKGPAKLWVTHGTVTDDLVELEEPLLFIKPTKGNAKEAVGPVSFTADYQKMFYSRPYETRNSYGEIVIGIEIVYCDKTADGWGDPQKFTHSSLEFSTAYPSISSDGTTLYYVSDMPGGYGATDIYYSKYSGGRWEKPRNLGPNINTQDIEKFPVLYQDTILYFSSNGHVSLGGQDILKSVFRDETWQKPVNLREPVNSRYDDFGFLPIDGEKLAMLTSNRPGGKGDEDLYLLAVARPLLHFIGRVQDQDSKVLPNVKLTLRTGKLAQKEHATNEDGYYDVIVAPGEPYKLICSIDGYATDSITIVAHDDGVHDSVMATKPLVLVKLSTDGAAPAPALVAASEPAKPVEAVTTPKEEPAPITVAPAASEEKKEEPLVKEEVKPAPALVVVEEKPVVKEEVVAAPTPVVVPTPVAKEVEPAIQPAPKAEPQPVAAPAPAPVAEQKLTSPTAKESVAPVEVAAPVVAAEAKPTAKSAKSEKKNTQGPAKKESPVLEAGAPSAPAAVEKKEQPKPAPTYAPATEEHPAPVEVEEEQPPTTSASATSAAQEDNTEPAAEEETPVVKENDEAATTQSAPSSSGDVIKRFKNIQFANGSVYPDKSSYGSIGSLISYMRRNPNTGVTLVVRSSATGTESKNQNLSDRRAQMMRRYLQQQGIAASRINTVSLGASNPLYKCAEGAGCTEAEHAVNRSAEVLITGIPRQQTSAAPRPVQVQPKVKEVKQTEPAEGKSSPVSSISVAPGARTFKNITYASGSLYPDKSSYYTIAMLINFLKSNILYTVVLDVHSDAIGSEGKNQEVSDRRGEILSKYLQRQGISGNRIKVNAYGSSRIVNRCTSGVKCSAEEHAVNRRVEIRVEKE